MNLTQKLKTLGKRVADLVFPVLCVVCGTEGSFLCTDCQVKLPRLEKQICVSCKKPAPFGKTHPDCITRNILDGTISALPYAHPDIKKVISTFKYQFILDLAEPLSLMIIQAIKNQELDNYFSEFIILPVPLHKRRLSWRGFNQAELIGQALGKNLRIGFSNDLVFRSRFTKPQVDLTANDRKINIQNAFEIMRPVKNQKFLLVDDVITTGSTLNEIAKLLKNHGAVQVWAVTVAHG